jgi:hypothetical protein
MAMTCRQSLPTTYIVTVPCRSCICLKCRSLCKSRILKIISTQRARGSDSSNTFDRIMGDFKKVYSVEIFCGNFYVQCPIHISMLESELYNL